MARDLLGCVLRHDTPDGTASGIIVETEAYLGEYDLASHARFGRTPRASMLYAAPGTAYVYFIYGMYDMFNAVTDREGKAGAVLVRALEPLDGLPLMQARRGTHEKRRLTAGPAMLTMALGITLEQNGDALTAGPLGIYEGRRPRRGEVAVTPRIGVTGSHDLPLRYIVKGNQYVSR